MGGMSTEKEREAHERGYSAGYKAFARRILQESLIHLDSPDKDASAWKLERAETVSMLRRICEEYGDNDWPDDLHLSDVIEKHLWRNLPELEESE
jgi:hypothetical protein